VSSNHHNTAKKRLYIQSSQPTVYQHLPTESHQSKYLIKLNKIFYKMK